MLDDKNTAVLPVEPPTWQEVQNDPSFQALSPEKQLVSYDRWYHEVLPHVAKQSDWENEQTNFLTKTEALRKKLSEAAGGLNPDQARVKLASETLRAAKPDGDLSLDEERTFLKPLGGDIAKAFYDDRAGVNKPLPDVAPSLVDKALVPLGAGIANAPGAAMNMLDFMEHFLARIPDFLTGSKRSEAAAARMAERGKEADERREIAAQASGETWGSVGTVIGEQLPMLPAQLAVGGAGYLISAARGAVTASAMFGSLQSASQSFASNVNQRVQNGESVEQASEAELLPSIASGVITGAVTKIAGPIGINRLFREGGGKAVVSKLREVIIGAGGEMAEEITDEAGQIINDLTFGREVSLDDVVKRVGTAAVVASILGGGVNGLHAALAPNAKIDPAATALADELRKSRAPKTAEVVSSDARAAVVEEAALTPEGPAAVEQGIRLSSRQGADGTYQHEFSIPESATVEQLQQFRTNLDTSHLPEEAATAITSQLDAEIARKGGPAAPPTAPAAPETPAAPVEPAAPTAEPQAAAGSLPNAADGDRTTPYIVGTAIRDSAKLDNVVRGDEWNTGHDDFTQTALEAGIDADTIERGFIIRDPTTGAERFATREEAAPLAIAANQAAPGVTKLRSQDLIAEPVAAVRGIAEPEARAVIAPPGESLAPAPAARPLSEPGRPPSVAAAAKEHAVPRTAEEKDAKVEAGRAEGERIVLETGIVPSQSELHKLTGNSTDASKLLKELRARVAVEYPPETVAEGSKQTETRNSLTGDKLPSVIDADGKVRALFTNDPNLTAQQVDLGIASTSPTSRLYIPDELATTGKVNPAIRYAKEKETGKYYVIGADTVLPDGEILPVNGPDELTKPYQAAQRLSGVAQKPIGLDPKTLREVAAAVQKGIADRQLDFGPFEFDLEDATDPGEAGPAEGEVRAAIAVAQRSTKLELELDNLHEELAEQGFEYDSDGKIYDIRHLIAAPPPLSEAAPTVDENEFRQLFYENHLAINSEGKVASGRIFAGSDADYSKLPAAAQRLIFKIKGIEGTNQDLTRDSLKKTADDALLSMDLEDQESVQKWLTTTKALKDYDNSARQIAVAGASLTHTTLSNLEALAHIGVLGSKTETVSAFAIGLKALSKDTTIPANLRILAKELLKSGMDFSKVKLRFVGRPNTDTAGLYIGTSTVDNATIEINVAAVHVGGVVATYLHEGVHHVTIRKVDPNYRRTPVEEKAYQQITTAYNKVLAEAYKTETGKDGTPEELRKFAKAQSGDKRVKSEVPRNSVYYGLSDIREFVAETLSSARFQKFLASFESDAPAVRGKIGNLLNAVRNALKQLFAGQEVKRGSLLDSTLEAAFQLTRTAPEQGRVGTGKGTSAEAQRLGGNIDAVTREDLEARAEADGLDRAAIMVMTKPELFAAVFPQSGPTQSVGSQISSGPGWITKDGTFYSSSAEGAGVGFHDFALQLHILEATAPDTAKKFLRGKDQSFSALTAALQSTGSVRVTPAGDTTTIYLTGNPNPHQLQVLKDAAIEENKSLVHDLGESRIPRTLYSPDTARSAAAPGPEIVHEFGPDGKMVHSVNIPDGATPEQIARLTEQVKASKLIPDADKQRLTLEIEASAKSAVEDAAAATTAVSPAVLQANPGSLFDSVKKTAKKFMTAEGALPKEVFHRWQDREGEIKATTRDAFYTLRDLYAGLQKEFGISTTTRLATGLSKVPTEFVRKMNDALLGKVPMSSLPETVRGPLIIMRAQIDHLSQEFIDSGLASGDLASKFADNFGVYMTRSYRAFDDPNWPKNIPADVRNRTRAFLTAELKQDNPAATEADADRLMASMLQDWKEQGDTRGDVGRGPKLGAVNRTVLMKRGDISPEIREFMGEHQDPAINFMRSVTKMANSLGSARFLADVRKQGMGKFLFEDGKEPAGFASQIAAEGSATMAPLNGLRTSPEIAEAFREFGKAVDPGSAPFRFWMKLAAASKGAKTVGSLMTQVRNAQQFWFFGMNGHYDLSTAREALMATGADLGLSDSPQWRAFYSKMARLSVVNQSTQAGELRDTIREALLPEQMTSEFGSRSWGDSAAAVGRNVSRATFGAATRAYQISDDVGKIIGFLNERTRQAKQHPDWTPEQLDVESARRIRLTYPSYSMVPESIKVLRRQPVFGPFMTFGYETLRTTFHNLNFTADAIRNARTATDPGVRAAYMTEAAQRLAGQMAVLGGAGFGASLLMRWMMGLTADEEDDARKFLPEWDKNAQLLFTSKEPGKLGYVNISYSNPYSVIPDVIGAVVRGVNDEKSILTTVGNAAKEFLSPFIGENILAGAAMDVMRNKRSSNGRPVYNEGDTPEQKVLAVLGRFYESIEPGTLTRARTKVLPAIKGETRRGQELSVARELTSEFTGFKAQKMEFKDSLGYKGTDFTRSLRETDDILRHVVLREGNVTPEEIAKTYARSEGQRFALFQELHSVAIASIRRGVPISEVRSILTKRGNVSKEAVSAVLADRYVPQDLSKETQKRLREMKRPTPQLVSPYKGRALSGEDKPTPPKPTAL